MLGGIETYHWELWRRLAPERVVVLAPAHRDAGAFDAEQAFRVERTKERVLLPTPSVVRRVKDLITETGATLVLVDPPHLVGLAAERFGTPFATIVHGGVAVQTRAPGLRTALRRAMRG